MTYHTIFKRKGNKQQKLKEVTRAWEGTEEGSGGGEAMGVQLDSWSNFYRFLAQ